MQNPNDIELRSEEVQDILTKMPNWMIRWGNLLILSIVVLMFTLACFIKYPDIVAAKITITTNIPPEKVIAKTNGRIETILVKNKALVPKNTILAVIESSANYKDVLALKTSLEENASGKNFPFNNFKNAQFGDIESAYAAFQKDYLSDKLNDNLQPYQVETNAQILESNQISERLNLLIQQKSINENELKLQKNEILRFTTLYEKGVISVQEFEGKKLSYLQSEKNYKNLLSSISQLKSALIANNRSISGSKINSTKENVILGSNTTQAYFLLKKAIKDWELQYVLKSAIAGEVSFAQVWIANQTVNANDNVFAIVPNNQSNYIGKLIAPAQNSGKIKVGQQVNIRLANYPDREFGVLKGMVKNIALVPDKDGNLLLDIALQNGLKTNYKKSIPFQQEMQGTADIITEDLQLIERILYQFRGMFK